MDREIIKKLDLINYSNWLVWKKEIRNGEETKLPYNVKTDKLAKTTDSSTWANYKTAVKAYQNGEYDGIGFVFSASDPFCGVDLDDCRDPETEKIDQWAKYVIKKLHSYTEVSPSGTGIHIIVKAELPLGGNKTGNLPVDWKAPEGAEIEMYDQKRYFTMTLHKLEGVPAQAEDRQKEIKALHNKVFSQKKKEQKREQNYKPKNDLNLTDQELIDKAKRAKNGDKFSSLWNGNFNSSKSHSEADQALCSLLAFWTKKDPDRMEQLFRRSALMRDKWDSKRGSSTYGKQTIQKAIAFTQEGYTPKKDKSEPKVQDDDKKKKLKFRPTPLAKEIIEKAEQNGNKWEYVAEQGTFYYYDNEEGYWEKHDESYLMKSIRNLLINKTPKWDKKYKKNETFDALKDILINPTSERKFNVGINPNTDLINVKNGMLDWRTGELKEHHPDYYNQFQLRVEYDPEAKAPKWKQTLQEWIPEEEARMYIQEYIGYCLIPDTSLQKAVILHGSGENGKSTFLEVIYELFGEENLTNIPMHRLDSGRARFETFYLQNKLINLCSDIDPNYIKKPGIIKTLIRGEPLRAEIKTGKSFDFRPVVRLIFSANEIPKTRDKTDAWYRSFEIITFPNKFKKSDDDFDPHIKEKLIKEMPGVFNWALKGLKRLKENKNFTESETINQAKREYEKENDTIKAFIDDKTEYPTGSYEVAREVYIRYKDYCELSGMNFTTRKTFTKKLKELGFEAKHKKVNKKTERCYYGLNLKEK